MYNMTLQLLPVNLMRRITGDNCTEKQPSHLLSLNIYCAYEMVSYQQKRGAKAGNGSHRHPLLGSGRRFITNLNPRQRK